jgi:hypothetical protein
MFSDVPNPFVAFGDTNASWMLGYEGDDRLTEL